MKNLLRKLKENWLDYLVILISVLTICFVYLFTAFYQPKENDHTVNKENIIKVLRDKKNRISVSDASNVKYLNMLTPFIYNTGEHAYYNSSGNIVNASALTLTRAFIVIPNSYYVFDSNSHQVAYITFFDSEGVFISSQIKNGVILAPENAYQVRLSIFNNQLESARFYMGNIVIDEYFPSLAVIIEENEDYWEEYGYSQGVKFGYDEGYGDGYDLGYFNGEGAGYEQGSEDGYKTGYDDGVVDTEDYYEELIIPSVKSEYEEIGYNSGFAYGEEVGYNSGYNDGVVAGSNDFNILNFIRSLFDLIWGVLDVEMLPNIKLIYIVAIPLVLSIIRFILGWFR